MLTQLIAGIGAISLLGVLIKKIIIDFPTPNINVIIIKYKNTGETPLEVSNFVQSKLRCERISYAGRLDPMARGLLILPINNACKQSELLQTLTKTYEFDIVFGFQTDSYDGLGIILNTDYKFGASKKDITRSVLAMTGKHIQKYPPYSSFQVKNASGLKNPLWWWEANKRIGEVIIPSKEIEIYNTQIKSFSYLKCSDFVDIISNDIRKIDVAINPFFRTHEILDGWRRVKMLYGNEIITIVSVRMDVSTGTYIRAVAQKIANNLGTYAIAYDINRTKVGGYDVEGVYVL